MSVLNKYDRNRFIELIETYDSTSYDRFIIKDDGSIEILKGSTNKFIARLLGNTNTIPFLTVLQNILEGMEKEDKSKHMDEAITSLLVGYAKKGRNEADVIKTLYQIHISGAPENRGRAIPITTNDGTYLITIDDFEVEIGGRSNKNSSDIDSILRQIAAIRR